MEKTYFTVTYGCQMNIFDTGIIESIMYSKNIKKADNIYEADYIFLNGCSVREHAERRALGFIQSMKNNVKKNAKVFITGCLANSIREIPSFIDGLIGTVYYDKIPEILDSQSFVDLRGIDNDFDSTFYSIDNKITLYISIIKGCNNFCSYCIVPYLRGKEISYSPESLIEQIKRSINKYTGEIFLLGQNVNSYNYKGIGFEELLDIIAKEFKQYRIRFLTSHPKDYSEKLINTIVNNENIAKFIHLPFQSGSNKILNIMHRQYTIEDYLKKIALTREILPDATITTDIMVGFPFEDEDDFQKTMDIVKKVRFDDAFMYKYSKRKFTLAYFYNDPDEEIKLKRLKHLINLQNTIKIELLEKLKNTYKNVLIERVSKKNKNDYIGRDEGNRSIVVKGKSEIGKIYKVKIIDIIGVTPIGIKEEEKCI